MIKIESRWTIVRKSIFDIVSENIDLSGDIQRLLLMSQKEEILCTNGYNYHKLFGFVDKYCFKYWKYRGQCINVADYLKTLKFENIKKEASTDIDSLLTLIEIIYNFWNIANNELCDDGKSYTLQWCGNYYHLRDVMDDILGQYNHTAYMDKEKACILVVENKEEVTAVAEILPTSLSLDVIKYNHRSLKGEIELKKAILLKLANELEPKRAEIEAISKQLASDIFFMLNNMNVRHNNRSKKDKNYKEYVAKMRRDRLEKWYDELYQMMLLAILLLDNTDRTNKINQLKTKICGG